MPVASCRPNVAADPRIVIEGSFTQGRKTAGMARRLLFCGGGAAFVGATAEGLQERTLCAIAFRHTAKAIAYKVRSCITRKPHTCGSGFSRDPLAFGFFASLLSTDERLVIPAREHRD